MRQLHFNGKVLIIGCGAVSRCTLPLVISELQIAPKHIKVVDFVDNRELVSDLIKVGVVYEQARITPDNFSQIFSSWLSAGDILIDLGWNIETRTVLQWCRDNAVLYANTSVEVWDPYADSLRTDPRAYTLYRRQMELRSLVQGWGDNSGATAVLDHGANPGLVSHFTKRSLLDLSARILSGEISSQRREDLEQALAARDFPKLAALSGTKVIHISERDTQISDQPKQVDEFVNTWSVEGLFEEGIAPAEMGWGTHELEMPHDGYAFGGPTKCCVLELSRCEHVGTFMGSEWSDYRDDHSTW